MKSIEKFDLSENIVEFHSLSEFRSYSRKVYHNHISQLITDRTEAKDSHNWELVQLIVTADELGLLKEFNELFTSQNDGLIKFVGKSKILKSVNISRGLFNYKNSKKESEYSTYIIDFENGINGSYFRDMSFYDTPQIGQVYEFEAVYETKYSKHKRDFVRYCTIKLKDNKYIPYKWKKKAAEQNV